MSIQFEFDLHITGIRKIYAYIHVVYTSLTENISLCSDCLVTTLNIQAK